MYLIWAYLTFPSFFLKALCTRLLSLDFNRSCVIEVYVPTSGRSSDDNKLVEFFRVHLLLTPLRLVLVLQYLTNPSFMVLSSLNSKTVNRDLDRIRRLYSFQFSFLHHERHTEFQCSVHELTNQSSHDNLVKN